MAAARIVIFSTGLGHVLSSYKLCTILSDHFTLLKVIFLVYSHGDDNSCLFKANSSRKKPPQDTLPSESVNVVPEATLCCTVYLYRSSLRGVSQRTSDRMMKSCSHTFRQDSVSLLSQLKNQSPSRLCPIFWSRPPP